MTLVTHESDTQIQDTADAAGEAVYQALIEAWNARQAADFAKLFAEDGSMVGFDGSQVEGQTAIADHLAAVFTDHVTAPYLVMVREVRRLAPQVVLLRAVAGMIPPGQTDLNPEANAIQSLVATRREDRWEIDHFQTTPAAFHGRPEQRQALTDELRQLR